MTRSRLTLAFACAVLLAACARVPDLPSLPSLPAMPSLPSLPKFGRGEAPPPERPAQAAEAPPAPAEARTAPAGEWPQALSDVEPDPQIRFGRLPNGMRYALMRNATPSGQTSLRLRFDVGSLMERDDQRGLAHFLEHMAFNGSKAIPEGEMVKILERHGLAFGADTNASTGFTETIYKLDLPKSDDETVDTALMILRETASELTIVQDAVDRERGVVLSEERARDTPGYRVYQERLAFVLEDQLAARRLPIGTAEVLRSAGRDLMQDLYRRYYRPEKAVLAVVGDFDPDAMEAKLKARFGDWVAEGPAGERPDVGRPAERGFEAKLVVQSGSQLQIQLIWVSPYAPRPDTLARRREDIVEYVAFAALNRRLDRLARADSPPFLGAAAGSADEIRSIRTATITASAAPQGWRRALTAIENEQRRAVLHGLLQAEIDREIAEVRTGMTAAVAAAATRRTPRLAEEIVRSVDDGQVVTNPAQDLALFEEAVKGLTTEAAATALRRAFAGQGPLLFMASPEPLEGGEASLVAAYDAAAAAPVEPPSAAEAKTWPYESFGAAGKVVEEREAADLDAVFVRFENGVRLTVKPTRFRDDQILISVNIGQGRLGLPADRMTPGWAASAYINGGLKDLSFEDIQQVMASRIVGAGFGVGEDAFTLSASTRPEDLDVQMQLLAAYVVEPGWRAEAFERLKTYGATVHDQYDATPGGVASRDLPGLLHAGDARWRFPSRQEIAQAGLDDLKALLEPALRAGRIEVTVVGDTTVEKAVAAAAQTFGALARPAAAPQPPAGAAEVRFPAPNATPAALSHKGRADQAMAYVAWPAPDYFADLGETRVLMILTEVMRLRLIEELRESQGATYSPSAGLAMSDVFPGYGYLSASVEVPPDRLAGFFADVSKIAADLRERPVEADELDRAKRPRVEQVLKLMETNEFWRQQLADAQSRPERLQAIRTAVSGIERVTAADIRRAAQAYLDDSKAWRLTITPQR